LINLDKVTCLLEFANYSAHLTHHHPQPLLGKEGGILTVPVVRTPLLTKEGLGVVVLTVRKVSYSG